MLKGPPAAVAYSTTVFAPHPEAEMEPVNAGQTLFVIEMVGAPGMVQAPGTVVTAAEEGLDIVMSVSQRHLVTML
jgi:hypothetical protein